MRAIAYKIKQLMRCKQVCVHKCLSSNGNIIFQPRNSSRCNLLPDPIYDTFQKNIVEKNEKRTVKNICTWNIQELWWYCYSGDKITNLLNYIINCNVDVICLQEVFEPSVINLITTHPDVSKVFPYYITGNLYNSYILGENSGLLVLSTQPIVFKQFTPFSFTSFPDTFASKGALYFTIGETNFITTHLQSIYVPVAARQLSYIIQNSPFTEKTILLGDLNIPDPFTNLKLKRNNGQHTHLSGRTLDHIISLQSDIKLDVNVDYINLKKTSDHYPVIATIS